MTTTPEPLTSETGDLRRDAISVLSKWQAPNDDQDRLRRGYLQHLDVHPDALWRSCAPDHLTASALIVSADRCHVLLTLHARAGRWLQTGGHCEAADPSLSAAALREAREESGIDGLTVGAEPVLLSRHAVPFCVPNSGADPARSTHHLDVQFCASAPASSRARASDESDGLRWWPADALPRDADASLRALVAAAVRV